MKQRMEVTAAIIHDDGRVLICRRAAGDGGRWEFPGGRREPGESLEECIIREIKEELELDIKLLGIFTGGTYHPGGTEAYFTVFDAVITGGSITLNAHDEFRWVKTIELKKYELMPPDRDFAEKIISCMIE